DAGHLAHLRLAAELALGAYLARHARHFRGEHIELLDHRVDDGCRLQELAPERAPIDVKPHRLEEVALRDRDDRASDFRRGPEQVVDQRIDRILHLAPGTAGDTKAHGLAVSPFATDDLADALQLLRHALIGGDDLIEGVGDLADDPDPVAGQANREIADAHGLQRLQQLMQFRPPVAVDGGTIAFFRGGRGSGAIGLVGGGRISGLHDIAAEKEMEVRKHPAGRLYPKAITTLTLRPTTDRSREGALGASSATCDAERRTWSLPAYVFLPERFPTEGRPVLKSQTPRCCGSSADWRLFFNANNMCLLHNCSSDAIQKVAHIAFYEG